MVDTLVTADVYTSADAHEALWGPYWQAKDIGYIVFANAGKDISYARTADAGATWADTLVQAGSMEVMAVWRDRETPGDTGNLLHIAWTDDSGSDDVRYVNLDLSTETLGTIRTVTTAISSGTSVTNNHMFLFCKPRNGNLILGFATAVDNSVFRSTDGVLTGLSEQGPLTMRPTRSKTTPWDSAPKPPTMRMVVCFIGTALPPKSRSKCTMIRPTPGPKPLLSPE